MTIADDIKLIVPHKIQGTPVLYVVRQLVDGFMEQSMNGLTLKSIGIKRATGIIGLINLTYNLFRFE
jgi:hypothetical protein